MRPKGPARRAALLGALLLLAAAAWAEEWYDAYERGLEALKQGRAGRAAELFERAIRLRAEPGRGLITYGTNRIDAYHPYLRLAEAQLLAGDVEAARDAIERSRARGKEPPAEQARIAERIEAAAARAVPRSPPLASSTPPPASDATAVAASPIPPAASPAAPPASSAVSSPLPARLEARAGAGPARVVPAPLPASTTSSPSPASPAVSLAPTPQPARAPVDAPPASSRVALVASLVVLAGLGSVAWVWRRRVGAGSPTGSQVDVETRAITRMSTAGEPFGPYRLLESLGQGGMASVFKAERNGELCALKRPRPAFLAEPEFLERFQREAEIGRTLHHPNIVRIFERGQVGEVPYFTMELVRGETLQARIRARGALAPREAAGVIAQVAEALDYAHLKGVIHRDLKPSNIMLVEGGGVKVMDYGIARAQRFDGLTLAGTFLGTPEYVAPETAEGGPPDARSDLYSLGVVFYEMLTGTRPFVGDTPFATLRKHCTEPARAPSIARPGTPVALDSVVLRLLSKQPGDRYGNAEELLGVLREYLNAKGGA